MIPYKNLKVGMQWRNKTITAYEPTNSGVIERLDYGSHIVSNGWAIRATELEVFVDGQWHEITDDRTFYYLSDGTRVEL